MPDEQHSGKWAAEVYDFVYLFQRDGKRPLGLLFLQLGWLLLVVLLTKLASSEHPPYSFEFVLPSVRSATKIIVFKATTLYLCGSVILSLFWILYSRLYTYLISPILTVIHRLVIIAFFAFVFFIGLLDEVILGVIKLASRKKQQRSSSFLMEFVNPFLRQGWIRLLSRGRIGFAPVVAYSYDEDFRAAKLPLQLLAGAAEQCRLRLTPLGFAKQLAFLYLPVSARISTALKARWLRRWFDLDVILWGSFSEEDLWINFERRQRKLRNAESDTTAKIKIRYTPERQLIFEDSLSVNFPAIMINGSDAKAAYIVVAISTLEALLHRPKRPFYLSIYDRLSIYEEDVSALTLKLLMDHFFELPDKPLERTNPPNAREVLAVLMGRWARLQLRDFILRDRDEQNNLTAIAYMVERKCVRLLPQSVDDWYGMGALAFYLDHNEDAAEALKTAGTLDSKAHSSNPIMASVYAQSELDNSVRAQAEGGALARFSAYATRVIYTGDEFTRKSLQEDMAKSLVVIIHRNGTRRVPVISFIDDLFTYTQAEDLA